MGTIFIIGAFTPARTDFKLWNAPISSLLMPCSHTVKSTTDVEFAIIDMSCCFFFVYILANIFRFTSIYHHDLNCYAVIVFLLWKLT